MMRPINRRSFLKGLGALGTAMWSVPYARAFALPEDKIKSVHYYANPGDAQGRQGEAACRAVFDTVSGLEDQPV